ncbi:MAG: oligoendopeptidase F [Acidobacteria bacterium]|nr:oligoendopeptidase F [Acidobacteriota bacterium]
MFRSFLIEGVSLNVGLCLLATGLAVAADRAQVPEKYRWNLADLFPSREAFVQAKQQVTARIPEMAKFEGRLGESPQMFYEALSTFMDIDRQLGRIANYASQLHDEDTRDSSTMAMKQEVEQLLVQAGATRSFLRPEILAMDPAKVWQFVDAEPRLKEYRQFLDDILRWKPHTLSPTEERIVAQTGRFAGAGQTVHSVFTNADMPYPEVTLSSGEKVRLDAQAYTKYRALPNREDRLKVFQAFWSRFQEFRRTLGASLSSDVQTHVFDRDVHKFQSSVEAALFRDNIPVAVYRQLIEDVHANLPALHRYLELRRRIMKLDQLGYEDVYAPLVERVEMTYTPEQAMDLVISAAAPLGQDYVAALRRAYEERWVDFLPSTGKRSGAYSTGIYDVHPYQLLNFMGHYEDVSTLAHEFGHTIHTYLSNKTQPYPTHDYSIFVAEVASTLNENLLLYQMLGRAQDDNTRLFLLGSYLENLRGTLFRQTLFAEFELKIHELAEKGEALTGDALNALYLDLVRTYYGHDKGVCKVDDLYSVEWAYIPHFYYNFYVYQYATAVVASSSIARGIREEAQAAKPATARRDAYLQMLSSGSSEYPIELLRGAGVDMTTSAPFNAAVAEMNRIMDEMDKILARRKNP